MRHLSIMFSVLVVFGCGSRYTIERHSTSFVRRSPQITRIETGEALPEGSFRVSGTASYALSTPDVMQIADSSFRFHSNAFGDEFTIISSHDSYWYESRLMLSGEGLYAFSDLFSTGVSIDVSLGAVENLPKGTGDNIYNDNIEGVAFIRFAKQFGKWGVAIKPELQLTHFWGDRYWRETENGDTIRTATERLSFYSMNIRSASVLRYSIIENIVPFLGFHLKTQPFLTADNSLDSEVAYGGYFGVTFKYKMTCASPYVIIPGGSTVSRYRSPVSAGILLSFQLIDNDNYY